MPSKSLSSLPPDSPARRVGMESNSELRIIMSMDRSLKSASALVRHRNVLTRDERLGKLKEDEKWRDGQSVYGLPKVGHRKAAVAKTVKKEAAADGTAPVAGAAAPAAAGAKGAA